MAAPLSRVVGGRLAAAAKGPDRAALVAELEFVAQWNEPARAAAAVAAATFAETVRRRRLDANPRPTAAYLRYGRDTRVRYSDRPSRPRRPRYPTRPRAAA